MKMDVLQVLQQFSPIPLNENMLEKPVHAHLGDLALPCFPFAKELRKSPIVIAEEIAQAINHPLIRKAEAVNGYVNIFLNRTTITSPYCRKF